MDRPYDGKGADLFLAFERKLINVAERLGLPLAYTTSMDLDRDPHLLDGASALISMGHDEYWSPPEREHVTAARNAGVNVAFFGANAMFRRIRLAPTRLGAAPPGHLLQDQLPAGPHVRQAQCAGHQRLAGAAGSRAGVVADRHLVRVEPGDRRLRRGESRTRGCSAGTGARVGTRFRGLVGDEYDRVNPVYPVPRPIEILAHSPLTCRGVHSYSDSAYYTHSGGAGVFNTGTMRWVQSLAAALRQGTGSRPARVSPEQVTANVLAAFAQRSGGGQISGAGQPIGDARVAGRPDRRAAQPVAAGRIVRQACDSGCLLAAGPSIAPPGC